MAGGQRLQERTGRLFFWFAFLLIVIAIAATVLLANNRRNLDHLLDQIAVLRGQDPSVALPGVVKGSRTVRVVKGRRVPAATIIAPAHLFATLGGPAQSFLRAIRSDPRALCERLKETGFPDIAWTKSAAGGGSFECSSMLPIGTPARQDQAQSSVFVSVKGATQESVESFRVKFNIERPEDQEAVSAAGVAAAAAFLKQVQWENDDAVVARLRRLEGFDLRDFGSRIQLRKEFGPVPRYNFLASQAMPRGQVKESARFFDRAAWLPFDGAARSDGGIDPKLLPPRPVTTVRASDVAARPAPSDFGPPAGLPAGVEEPLPVENP